MELAEKLWDINLNELSITMKKVLKPFRLLPVHVFIFFTASLASCDITEDLLGGDETITRIEGEWTVDEDSDFYKSGKSVYTVTISPDPDTEGGVIIDNFYGLNVPAYAVLSGMSLIVNTQTMAGGYEVEGSGRIDNNYNEIVWEYTVDDGSGAVDSVTAVYTKN
jgi:hypothetical protein